MDRKSYFACHLMAGMMSENPTTGLEPKILAKNAVRFAEALMDELGCSDSETIKITGKEPAYCEHGLFSDPSGLIQRIIDPPQFCTHGVSLNVACERCFMETP